MAAGNPEVDELVRRAQQQDRVAFGELYELYEQKIYTYLSYRLQRQPCEAEDLTAEVFLKVLEKIGSYRSTGFPFTAWLYRVAYNHLMDYVRRRQRQPTSSLEELPPGQELIDFGTDEMAMWVDSQVLTEVLPKLTPAQRNVIILRFVQDLSIIDTAHIMGKSEEAVKKTQRRALGAMRRAMRE